MVRIDPEAGRPSPRGCRRAYPPLFQAVEGRRYRLQIRRRPGHNRRQGGRIGSLDPAFGPVTGGENGGRGSFLYESRDFQVFFDDLPVWIIDPVDGTRNFAAGNRESGAIVALAEQNQALAGWIYDPTSGGMDKGLLLAPDRESWQELNNWFRTFCVLPE